jgi:Putative addiction module component
MNSEVVLPLERMSVAEKLEVIDAIWQALIKREGSIPVPDWHKQILESRRRAYLRGDIGYTSWEDAKDEIRRRVS